ncbi:MAG: sn-glycerol-3-phosphate ABC transporter ATP-binding protein UgpC [Myxococcaceae bacterium]|nr:sn-glycerol-3-phosphate ABC transporter ATP-binding protein UgpC [Myxococcaceae bacterium]
MAEVKLEGVTKSFGRTKVIEGLDLEIADGELVVFVGPSGCGKSTLLRMIAGLEDTTAGEIYIGGRRVTDEAPARRGVSMVFQSYALYPHMKVYKNIAFGLTLAKTAKETIDERVRRIARLLQIADLLDRYPRELSGGQRQRVAIARAIVREPKVFLFDEPLSNLDAALRAQTRLEIARLHRDLKATSIYVTHDQVEAMTLADRMVVLNRGKVEQVGPPGELYHRPQTLFVAGFLGSPRMNFLKVDVADAVATSAAGAVPVDVKTFTGPATLGIRPEDLHLAQGGTSPTIRGEATLVEDLGETRIVHVQAADGTDLAFHHREGEPPRPGTTVGLVVTSNRLHLFDADGLRVPNT